MIYLQAPHPLSHTLTLPGVGPNRSFVLSFLKQTTLFPIPNAIPGKLIFNSPAFLLPLNSGYCLLLSARASPCPACVFCTQNTPISLGFALPPSARQLMRPGQAKTHPRVLSGAGRKKTLPCSGGADGFWQKKAPPGCSFLLMRYKIGSHCPGVTAVLTPSGCSGQRSIKSFKTPAGLEKPAWRGCQLSLTSVQLINFIIKPFRLDWDTQKTKVPPLPSALSLVASTEILSITADSAFVLLWGFMPGYCSFGYFKIF